MKKFKLYTSSGICRIIEASHYRLDECGAIEFHNKHRDREYPSIVRTERVVTYAPGQWTQVENLGDA